MSKRVYFEPEKSLIELGVLWWTVGILAVLSGIVATVIICNSDLVWDFSYEGFNQAITIFKVPLAILALIIPIVALLAANHRSEQTKKQIIVVGGQNNFANYYKHVEEFNKYLNDTIDDGVTFTSKHLLHKSLFPMARQGNYLMSGEITSSYKDMVLKVVDLTEKLSNSKKGFREPLVEELLSEINDFAYKKLRMEGYFKDSGYVNEPIAKRLDLHRVRNRRLKIIIQMFVKVSISYEKICLFEPSNQIEPLLYKVKAIDLDAIHESMLLDDNIDESFSLKKCFS